MKAPWRDKTGLAKWVAIFSTSLGIATGLCGLNFASFMLVGATGSGQAQPLFGHASENIGIILIMAGYVEVLVIVISSVALFVLTVVMIVRQLMGKRSE